MNINDSSCALLNFKIVRIFTILLIALICNLSCQNGNHPIGYNHEIFDAVKTDNPAKVKALLKENPKLVFSEDNFGQTPLIIAVGQNNKDMTALLLANKAKINAKNNDGSTPLQAALWQDRKNMAEFLRQHGGRE